jgi:S1-C subfamily serine protease
MLSIRPDRGPHRPRPAGVVAVLTGCVAALSTLVACGDEETAVVASVPGAGVPVEQVAAEHGGAVWRVETEGCGWTGYGSAFAVDATRLVTNHHVIANDTSPTVRSREGEVRAGRVIGTDPERDIAVIEVDEPLGTPLPWAPTDTLQVQERLVVLGYPQPEYAFTVSYGEIVAFGGVAATDIVVSNAPIDRGNSGGPALRGDGSVVGVVTRVVLDDPDEHLAIVYPTDRVIAAVDAAVDAPRDVLSDCGLGPDYVPPAPEGIDLREAPPPPSPEITATSRPAEATTTSDGAPAQVPTTSRGATPTTPRPGPSRTTPTSAPTSSAPTPCPQRQIDVAVTERHITTDDDGHRRVEVRGVVSNGASRGVVVLSVRVTFDGEAPVVVEAAPETAELDSGASTTWEAAAIVPDASDSDPPPEVAVEWRWRDPALDRCPSGGAA